MPSPGAVRLIAVVAALSLARPADATVREQVQRVTARLRAQLTASADRLEAGLTGRPRRQFRGLRRYSPMSLGPYTVHKFRQDTLFLASYASVRAVAGIAVPVGLLAAGVDPLTTAVLRGAMEPTDYVILLFRERARLRRTQPGATLGDTLRHLKVEYRDFVAGRRAENRRHLEDE